MLRITNQTRNLLLVMAGIVVAGVLIAWIYYRYQNAAEDPRVKEARILLNKYDELMQEGAWEEGLQLLDSIENIYRKTPCYAGSFEMGVIHNNRGSAWLTMALYKTGDSMQRSEMLVVAEKEIRASIRSYQQWLQQIEPLTEEQVKTIVIRCFPANDPVFEGKDYLRILQKRVHDIQLARVETPRRLSVSYSNLGIIQRHQYLQDSAVLSYMTALKLWKRNPTAKNNLNTLLGRPQEDESIIEQLFPPDRRKPE